MAKLIERHRQKDTALIGTRELHEAAPGVVFMFPGQGSQYVNMGRDLHDQRARLRKHFDQCCDLFSKEVRVHLADIIFPNRPVKKRRPPSNSSRPSTHRPRLFTMHYSLAKLWMHWGITRTR
jgi:acyl transferase domain-containing protein